MSKTALDILRAELPYYKRPIWTAADTDFTKLMTGPPAFVIYTSQSSMPRAPGDSLNWAISLTRCLQSCQAYCDTLAPFRIGPIATDSCETMLSVLYAGLAGVEMSKLSERTKPLPEMMRDVGVAWRCLDAAGTWPYDTALRPPQLDPAFRDWVITAAALLTYHHLEAAAPQTEKLSRRRIATLFLLGRVGSTRVRAWAESRRCAEITRHWAVYHSDPRIISPAAGERDADAAQKMAYAVVRVLREGERDAAGPAVEQLLSYGSLLADQTLRSQALSVGKEGYLRPPMVAQNQLIEASLPTSLLKGDPPAPKIALDGAEPLKTGMYELNPGHGAPLAANHKDLRPAARSWWPANSKPPPSAPPPPIKTATPGGRSSWKWWNSKAAAAAPVAADSENAPLNMTRLI